MSKIFLISGMGADGRLFKNLDLSGFEVVPIQWITPDQHDTIATYASKLIAQFGIVPQCSVIGVSLGGMIAVEIAKQVELKRTIIISSIKLSAEAPFYYKFLRVVPFYKLLTGKFIIRLGFLFKPIMGKMVGKDGHMFYLMLKNTSPRFLTWTIHAALHWGNETIPRNLVHIMGDADLIFSHKKTKGAIVIPGGDHMMVLNRAKKINPIIREVLSK